MIVRSKSTACPICQKRKLKCDKSKPRCSQCMKDGWNCPGYLPIWRTKPQTSKSPLKLPYQMEWVLESTENGQSRKAHQIPSGDPYTSIHRPHATRPSPEITVGLSSSLLSRQLVHLLEDIRAPNMKIQNLGSFLEFVPSRLGYNKALDDAIQCICTAYMCVLSPNHTIVSHDRREYFTALQSLRQCVLDETEALSSNVLGAAVLLSWYEILADNLDDGWLAHIRGCAKLIELRGPFRHQAEFDRQLLYAQEGLISGDALMKHEPSFLDSPTWTGTLMVLKQSLGDNVFGHSLKESNERMARLSTLLRDSDVFLQSRYSGQVNLEFQPLLDGLIRLQSEITQSLAGESSHKTGSEFQDSSAIVTCKYALALLVVDTTLLKIIGSVGREESLGDDIVVEQLPENDSGSIELWNLQIEHQIDETVNVFHRSILIARTATPFSTRKMEFMCRIMCANTRQRVDQHPVWRRLEKVIEGVNNTSCLASLQFSAKQNLKLLS